MFFPFIGEYRLEYSIRKTNNYFVPEKTPLLAELIDLYNDNSVYYISLNRLGNEGYIIRYEVLYDALTTIRNELFNSRQTLYMGMMVFGVVVSYVLTKVVDPSNKQKG